MEIVRHRLASFSQESTRYCNYSKDKFDNQLTFIIPPWCDIKEGTYKINFFGNTIANPEDIPSLELPDYVWFHTMAASERYYKSLIDLGWKPQEARSVLPNSLKTEIVVTANLREWRTIFIQRTAAAAHPQIRELMRPLLADMKTFIPVVFDDIEL
jgi:thymidylate synthase (FAD)